MGKKKKNLTIKKQMAKKKKITETTMTTRTPTVNFEGFSLTLNDQSRKIKKNQEKSRKIKDKQITIILTRDIVSSSQ